MMFLISRYNMEYTTHRVEIDDTSNPLISEVINAIFTQFLRYQGIVYIRYNAFVLVHLIQFHCFAPNYITLYLLFLINA